MTSAPTRTTRSASSAPQARACGAPPEPPTTAKRSKPSSSASAAMSAAASATERPSCGSERAVAGPVVGDGLARRALVEARVRVPREAAAGRAVRDDHREAVLGAARDVGQRAAVGSGQRAFAHGPDHRVSPGDVRGGHLGRARAAEQLQAQLELGAQQLEHLRDALLAAGREAAEHGAAGERRAGAERERLEHVRAAADAAVDQHLDPLADRLDHLRQRRRASPARRRAGGRRGSRRRPRRRRARPRAARPRRSGSP